MREVTVVAGGPDTAEEVKWYGNGDENHRDRRGSDLVRPGARHNLVCGGGRRVDQGTHTGPSEGGVTEGIFVVASHSRRTSDPIESTIMMGLPRHSPPADVSSSHRSKARPRQPASPFPGRLRATPEPMA